MRDLSLSHARALAVAVTLGLCVSCGDDGTGPGGNGNGVEEEAFADLAAGVGGAFDAYFASNAGAFTALQTFVPFFQTAFSPAVVPGALPAGALLQGCIDPSAFGTTFEFDFQQSAYVPGAMTGAPADGVRFLLYQEQQAQGHADVTCPGDLPTIQITLAVVWNGVEVFALAGTGLLNQNFTWQFNSTSATLTNPANSATLDFSMGGTGAGAQVVSSRLGFDAGGITVTFGRDDSEGLAVSGSATATEWSASLMASGPSDGMLQGNVLLSTPSTTPVVVACLSGFYDDLFVAVDPSILPTCAGEFPTRTFAPDPQADIDDTYQALRTMLDTVIGILETGIQIAIAAA